MRSHDAVLAPLFFFASGLVAILPVGVEVIRAEMFAFEFDQALFEFE